MVDCFPNGRGQGVTFDQMLTGTINLGFACAFGVFICYLIWQVTSWLMRTGDTLVAMLQKHFGVIQRSMEAIPKMVAIMEHLALHHSKCEDPNCAIHALLPLIPPGSDEKKNGGNGGGGGK
jgi:hypothetical protein